MLKLHILEEFVPSRTNILQLKIAEHLILVVRSDFLVNLISNVNDT